MAICKYCNLSFDWAHSNGKFVLLVPIGEDTELERAFIDADGVYRADHRLLCTNKNKGDTTSVVRLLKPINL